MKYAVTVLACLLLVGVVSSCSKQELTITPFEKAALEQQASRPVTCVAGDDCNEKWNRAIQWVNANSAQKIKTISDNIIQTHDVMPLEERVSYPAFTIIKYADGKNRYVIEYSSACDEFIKCDTPSALELKASFVYFVMGRQKITDTQRQHMREMKFIAEQIEAAIGECRDMRIRGQLKSYRESAECSNSRIMDIFKRNHYPYMDLAESFTAKRLELASMVDGRKITEVQMQTEMTQFINAMNETELVRSIETLK